MKVANPIYDIVFKYLLSDNEIAKLIISNIIDEDIVSLKLKPTEHNVSGIGERKLAVYRIDFAATIKNKDGSEKLVLIEIQKAKFHEDIIRFRKYLGKQYSDENNVVTIDDKKVPLPIVTIYFLGHRLDHARNPVIKVKRKYYDAITNEKIKEKEKFIESLTHDSFIIQIPELTQEKRNKLEVLLSIFDQSLCTEFSRHYLELQEESYPSEYQKIIRNLLKAGAEKVIQDTMDIEDEIVADLDDLERRIANKEKTIEDNKKTIEDNKKTIEDKEKTIEDNKKTIKDKEKTIEDKEKTIKDNKKTILLAVELLVKSGISETDAKKQLGIKK